MSAALVETPDALVDVTVSRELTDASRESMSAALVDVTASRELTDASRESMSAALVETPDALVDVTASRESTEASSDVRSASNALASNDVCKLSTCLILINAMFITFIFRPKDTLCAFISIYQKGPEILFSGHI